ncbi:hypothetical protein TNCV_674301 [Trichonephila clavipes]|nr:hypothetical protein TNCV_674301 [Trichonephila clavipes]
MPWHGMDCHALLHCGSLRQQESNARYDKQNVGHKGETMTIRLLQSEVTCSIKLCKEVRNSSNFGRMRLKLLQWLDRPGWVLAFSRQSLLLPTLF